MSVSSWGRLFRVCSPALVVVGVLAAMPSSASATIGGTELWARRYDGTGNSSDSAISAAASPDGSKVFVTGQSTGTASGYDYATVAYAASTGAELWAKRYNGPGNGDDLANSVAASPDGSKVFVTGQSAGAAAHGGSDYATIVYDASSGAG